MPSVSIFKDSSAISDDAVGSLKFKDSVCVFPFAAVANSFTPANANCFCSSVPA